MGLTLRIFTAGDDPDDGRAIQQEAQAYLGPLGVRAEYSVARGKAAKAVSAALADDPPDLVIMGMRGHSVLHDLILGSTAEQLMRSVPLPILLVP
jgi:nucleotide-binding universal stress UspA family protein